MWFIPCRHPLRGDQHRSVGTWGWPWLPARLVSVALSLRELKTWWDIHRLPSRKNDDHRQNEFTIQLILWITARKRELNTLLQCHPTTSPPRNAKTAPKELKHSYRGGTISGLSTLANASLFACNTFCFSIACLKNFKIIFSTPVLHCLLQAFPDSSS